MKLGKYSIGIGDRFAHQGVAQLAALQAAGEAGIEITPVWNKSAREHSIIGSTPADTRRAADAAVAAAGWMGPYFTDADHIGLKTVDAFIDSCDFYTIDVADFVGRTPEIDMRDLFIASTARFMGKPIFPGAPRVTREFLEAVARKYLAAVGEAGRIYRHIAGRKGDSGFITEMSMDEADAPQTPEELFFILSAAALEKIPLVTIAPKWSGRFNKGVDYQGNDDGFAAGFEAAADAVWLAVSEFGLPPDLKLSIHSGSDKFSLYPRIRQVLEQSDAGLHLKTAGTTWLEEVAGLAAAGGEGWELVKEIYRRALSRFEELCRPYQSVLAIDRGRLPAAEELAAWSGADFERALTHDRSVPQFNPHLRQFIHVSYGVAAGMGREFLDLLEKYEGPIGRKVTANLWERHIRPLFPIGENAL
jgi:hypothetical protein